MAAPNFWGEIFFTRKVFLKTGEDKKSHMDLYLETMFYKIVTFFSKMITYFRPCDLRCCHITNKYHRYPSLIDVLVEFDKLS